MNSALQFLIIFSSVSAARLLPRAFLLLWKAGNARLIIRRRFVAIVFASISRTSLSPWDAIGVKRARMLSLSRQGQRLKFGMRRTSHAYLIQKPDLCRFVIVTATKRYRILQARSADSL